MAGPRNGPLREVVRDARHSNPGHGAPVQEVAHSLGQRVGSDEFVIEGFGRAGNTDPPPQLRRTDQALRCVEVEGADLIIRRGASPLASKWDQQVRDIVGRLIQDAHRIQHDSRGRVARAHVVSGQPTAPSHECRRRTGRRSPADPFNDEGRHPTYVSAGFVDDIRTEFRWFGGTNPVSMSYRKQHRDVAPGIAHSGHIPHVDAQRVRHFREPPRLVHRPEVPDPPVPRQPGSHPVVRSELACEPFDREVPCERHDGDREAPGREAVRTPRPLPERRGLPSGRRTGR